MRLEGKPCSLGKKKKRLFCQQKKDWVRKEKEEGNARISPVVTEGKKKRPNRRSKRRQVRKRI